MTKPLTVAYFTMEIAPPADMPTFAGGLGILAGDLMQSCADLAVPTACVTICWKHGYLHQTLRTDGSQTYEQTEWNPSTYMTKVPETVTVKMEGRDVIVGAWKYDLRPMDPEHGAVVPVVFLDTDLPENEERDRDITKHLYGGDQAMRVRQELVLGVGGIKMLRALGVNDVGTYHMNEGHCAFLTLELLRERGFNDMEVKKSCAFTTHTPVKAGHDVFPYDMAWGICGDILPWHIKKLAGEDALSMTQLAMTMSRYTCGVSQVHGKVARDMLQNSAVDAITNGVHHARWTEHHLQELFDKHIPGWREDPSLLGKKAGDLPDAELWTAHQAAKKRLLDEVRERTGEQFDVDTLTIVSARRVVPYKRPELLYTNLERLREIGGGKLQIIHAGNAHPHDQFSQDVIRRMIERSKTLRDSIKITYLPNYNPTLAELLVSGADVWLNTPTRLMEASGTSGMKACLNGALNLSTLDGWWIEGYAMDPRAGWRIGPLASALPPDDTRLIDAEDLYTLLQYQIIPEYEYPGRERWIHRMKQSIALMGYFNSHRCIREYIEKAWTV